MPAAKRVKNPRFSRLATILTLAGTVLILAAIFILAVTFSPVIKVELGYELRAAKIVPLNKNLLIPVDRNFGIIIPKIGANAKIIANVDPYDSRIYQVALTKGIAQAKGTVIPGEPGNSFLFAHSSVNFYEATHYNSVFYLLDKMEKGDEIDIFVNGKKLVFQVTEKKLVAPQDVNFLTQATSKRQITLMTCWPPGTTLKRLLVIGELKGSN